MMARCVSAGMSVGMVVAMLLVGPSGSAHADQSLHATGRVTTGFSNNITNVPENDQNIVLADAFASIAPGVLFTYESPRFGAEMNYTLNARLFLRETGANSFSNFLSVRTSHVVSPTSELDLAVTGAAGRINAFDTQPAESDIDLGPTGDIAFARISGSQIYTKQLNWLWRVRQTSEASAFTPTDETTSINTNWNVGGSLSLERNWQRHRVTGTFRGRYVHNERIDEDTGNRLDPDLQIITGPTVRWLWDTSATISTAASVGVVRVFQPDNFGQGIYQPSGSVQLSYLKDRSVVTLRYLHDVTANTLLGQTNAVDRVELRGFYPTTEILDNSGVTGALGLQHSRLVDLDMESLASSSNQGLADLAGVWRQQEGLSWAIRYQYSRGTRAIAAIGSTQNTSRHQIQLMLNIRYPQRQAIELPERVDERVDEASEETDNRLQRR